MRFKGTIIFTLVFLVLAVAVHCKTYPIFESEAVVSTATITSNAFKMKKYRHFSVDIKATSATGTPDLLVTYEVSSDGANWITPDRGVDIWTNLTTETQHVETFSPAYAMYIRLKIKGNAGNPADTIVDFFFFNLQE